MSQIFRKKTISHIVEMLFLQGDKRIKRKLFPKCVMASITPVIPTRGSGFSRKVEWTKIPSSYRSSPLSGSHDPPRAGRFWRGPSAHPVGGLQARGCLTAPRRLPRCEKGEKANRGSAVLLSENLNFEPADKEKAPGLPELNFNLSGLQCRLN